MHVLDLPDDVFLDIFHILDFESLDIHVRTLKALRLTCKRFVPLVKAQFFSLLHLKIDYNIPARTILAHSIGGLVRTLSLDLFGTPQANYLYENMAQGDALLSALITKLPNLREITIHAICDSRLEFPQLTQAIGTLTSVQDFRILETNVGTKISSAGKIFPVSDGLVRALLNSSGSSLLSLVFDGQSNMSPETFEALRRNATQLQRLWLRCYVGVQCRAALSENVPWACRETLTRLSFLDCRGAHSGAIAAGVGNGLWCTNLRSLEVLKSGDHDDIPDLPYPLNEDFAIPIIEEVHYEHAFRWELVLLGKLKAKEVMLTYLPRVIVISLVNSGGFPGMEHLRIVKRPGDADVHESSIKAACELRRVKLSMDGAGTVLCDCPYGFPG